MKVRWPGFFAKFHELVGSLSVKYSSTLGSPSKGQGGMLALSLACIVVIAFTF
jgi:hypothetical protein